jgi:hypothetical protein
MCKDKILQVRMSAKDYAKTFERMKKMGLTTPRTRCRYLRYLLTCEDLQPVASNDQWEALFGAFADTARIGGLLNQIAHHINRSYLDLLCVDSGTIQVDGQRLHALLKELEAGQHSIKDQIISLMEQGRHH